jgi:hypothetical protein
MNFEKDSGSIWKLIKTLNEEHKPRQYSMLKDNSTLGKEMQTFLLKPTRRGAN